MLRESRWNVVKTGSELNLSRPVTWVLLAGFVAILLGSAYLWLRLEIRPRREQRG